MGGGCCVKFPGNTGQCYEPRGGSRGGCMGVNFPEKNCVKFSGENVTKV